MHAVHARHTAYRSVRTSHGYRPLINIAKQQNKGVDLTGLIQQNLGRFGKLTALAQMTWQLKDKFALFADTEVNNNGEIGDPRWIGDFNFTWQPRGGDWTIFYGLDVIGSADNKQDFKDANGGSLCILQNLNPGPGEVLHIRPDYCVDVSVPATFYHAASVTKEFPRHKLELTLGVSNLFDTHPPRTSTMRRCRHSGSARGVRRNVAVRPRRAEGVLQHQQEILS